MYYFVGVNYGTSDLIPFWVNSIKSFCSNFKCVVVDNFKNEEERVKAISVCRRLGIDLIESENVGYGRGLNKAIAFCFRDAIGEDFVFIGGNLDISFLKIPGNLPSGKNIYVPKALEGQRNRNPFLKKFQRRFVALYRIPLALNSPFVLFIISALIKMSGWIKSPAWTLHGSLFCFHSSCVSGNGALFNENSFLYCEEMEFGSYMESVGANFIQTDIEYRHEPHAATGVISSTRRAFMKVWAPSYRNWLTRWG